MLGMMRNQPSRNLVGLVTAIPVVALALATLCALSPAVRAAGPGQWSPQYDLGNIAVHLALVPGVWRWAPAAPRLAARRG